MNGSLMSVNCHDMQVNMKYINFLFIVLFRFLLFSRVKLLLEKLCK